MNKLKIAKKRIGGGINKAFTLVELVVVIAIIAILSGVSVAGYFGYVASANKSADNSLVKQLDTLVKIADEDELVNAVEMRSYFAENGITSLNTKNKDNIIVYDINTKSVSLATAKEGEYNSSVTKSKARFDIDGAKYANVFSTDGTPFTINERPICPEEMFSGKMILSTGGNALSNFVYNVRNGKIAESLSYLNTLYNEGNGELSNSISNLISSSLFIEEEGSYKFNKVVYSTTEGKYIINESTDYSDIDNVIFVENAKAIVDFPAKTAIKNVVIPSSITSIQTDAFDSLINTETKEQSLAVAFLCSDDIQGLQNIKQDFNTKGVTITTAESVTEALRSGKTAFISGIKRYVPATTEAELISALNNPTQGDCIIVKNNITLNTKVDVGANVQLLVPTVDNDQGYTSSGFNHNGTTTIQSPSAYCTLTLGEEGIININPKGKLLVNSISGQPYAGPHDQEVNGAYGQIVLSSATSAINVENGGLLDNFGYITGSGTVNCSDGGEVRDLYVVRRWRGGTQALHIFNSVYPMNEYDMHNIQAKTVISSGGKLVANVKMFALSEYYYTRFPQVDNENGLIRLSSGAKLTKTYEEPSTNFTYGKETYSIDGGATFSSSTLPIVGISLSTKDYVYPIDGDINFNLNNGSYSFSSDIKGYKFMNGSQVTLGSNSSLSIPKNVNVSFYDNNYTDPFENVDTGLAYPIERGDANLILSSNSSLDVKGSIGGSIVINSSDFNSITSTITDSSVKTFEANGFSNGTKAFVFPASYKDSSKSKIYYSSPVEGTYTSTAWMDVADAVSDFNSLSIVKNPVDVIDKNSTTYTSAQEAVNKYFNLINSGVASTDITTIETNYSSNIVRLENALNPLFTIGDNSYSTLDQAIEAVQKGDVIYMHNDTTIEGVFTFPEGKEFILDLGDYSITFTSNVINNAKLTIQNGTFYFENLDAIAFQYLNDNGNYYESIPQKLFLLNNTELNINNLSINYVVNPSNATKLGGYIILNNGLISSISRLTINTFSSSSNEVSLNGITGILNYYSSTINNISYTSVTTGTSALLNYSNIGLIDNCTFIMSEDKTGNAGVITIGVSMGSPAKIEEIRDSRIISNNTYSIYLIENSALNKISGEYIGNKNDGIFYISTNSPILIMNGTYLKNNSTGYTDKIFNITSSQWTTDVLKFEENYAFNSVPLSDGVHDGYYSTKVGYSITYVDTYYNESTGNPITDTINHYGKEVSYGYYNQTKTENLISLLPTKYSSSKTYRCVGWMDENGAVYTNTASITANKILYAKYEITDTSTSKSLYVQTTNITVAGVSIEYGYLADSFDEVFSNINSDMNIYLLKNYTSNKSIEETIGSNNLTINLNGKNLTFTEGAEYGFNLSINRNFKILGSGTISLNSTSAKSLIKLRGAFYSSNIVINNINLKKGELCPDTCSFFETSFDYLFFAATFNNVSLISQDGTSTDAPSTFSGAKATL